MDNQYYTYAYLREDGTPYYIGKGKKKRAYHPYNRNAKCPPKERILFLKKNLSEEEAIKHEIYMISLFGRKNNGTGILHNFTDGGEGKSGLKDSLETKRKKSQAMLGDRNPMFGIGDKHPMYGSSKTDEFKQYLSECHTGRKWYCSPDGLEERMFHPGNEISGWKLGRKEKFGVQGWETRKQAKRKTK
jgi:hypothetical protein